MDVEKIQVIDDDGNELEFDVLFTFDSEETGKKYVLYYDGENMVSKTRFQGVLYDLEYCE